MKALLGIVAALVLCACSSAPQVHTSFYYDRPPIHSMDLTDPHFYMDDDEAGAGVASAPPSFPHYSVDPFCASSCQSKGGSAGYCDRACGF
jgi:hypothetical protein